MSDASQRLCDRLLNLCRATPEVTDREIADALVEALAVIACRMAENDRAAGYRIVKSATRALRSNVRIQSRAA
jgi:hypothetical protein